MYIYLIIKIQIYDINYKPLFRLLKMHNIFIVISHILLVK